MAAEAALGARYDWQELIRRDFACGRVLLNPPDRPAISVQFGRSYQTIEGATLSSASISADESLILPDDCALGVSDVDDDGVLNAADNCLEVANVARRDTDGDACAP